MLQVLTEAADHTLAVMTFSTLQGVPMAPKMAAKGVFRSVSRRKEIGYDLSLCTFPEFYY